jgi:predicted proteasome-type protease
MTYCVAIKVNDGLVFCSDSRTNAGIDQLATYSKIFSFGIEGERALVADPYLLELKSAWDAHLKEAFSNLTRYNWSGVASRAAQQ